MDNEVSHETIYGNSLEPHTKALLDNGEKVFITNTMDSMLNNLIHAKETGDFIWVLEIKQKDWNSELREPNIRYLNIRKVISFEEVKKHCIKESGKIYYDWPRKFFY